MSSQIHLTVKPIPKTFSGAVWLPAKNLTLVESRSDKTNNVTVGDSITRNITVRADGLLAAQLPALDAPKLDNAKIYNDQPTLDDQQDASGVHGKRVENMALIPSKAGDLQLPEVRIVWWDVDSDSEKVATLSPSILQIAAGVQNSNTAMINAAPTENIATTNEPATDSSASLIGSANSERWWQAATAALALAWLITLYLYWRLRRDSHRGPTAVTESHTDSAATASEDTAFRHLKEVCRTNDPAAARRALLVWARRFYRDAAPHTIEELLQIAGSDLLIREIRQLDNRLFGTQPDSEVWNGENLLSVVRELRTTSSTTSKPAAQLPPLYPIV
jgi:hypothetical protein